MREAGTERKMESRSANMWRGLSTHSGKLECSPEEKDWVKTSVNHRLPACYATWQKNFHHLGCTNILIIAMACECYNKYITGGKIVTITGKPHAKFLRTDVPYYCILFDVVLYATVQKQKHVPYMQHNI